jgi:hypothetical protein
MLTRYTIVQFKGPLQPFASNYVKAKLAAMIKVLFAPFLRILFLLKLNAWHDQSEEKGQARSRSTSRSRSRNRYRERTPIRRNSRATSSTDLPIRNDDDQWTWTSRSWWGDGWASESQYKSSPKHRSPKHREKHSRDSDTGVQLPPSFKPDEYYLDRGTDRDLPLPRRVVSTEFSISKGTADSDVTKIPVHKLLYKGIANWTLRLVAAGKPVFFILVKSYQLSIFVYQLTRSLKDVSIEEVALSWNKA